MSEPVVSKDPKPAVSGPLAGLERWLYDMLVVRAPFQIPKSATDWIVQYGPWITLVIGVLMLPVLLAALTTLGWVGSVSYSVGASVVSGVGSLYWLAVVMLVIQIVVMFASVPMLLKRQRNGWLLVFYANLLSLAYGVFNAFSFGYFLSSLISTAVGAVVGMYILFQLRSYYTK